MSVQILKVKEGVKHVNSHSQQSEDEHVCSRSEWTESGISWWEPSSAQAPSI